ncbi:hypothetical protein ZIOFF_067730 [Zingiber officinale]|uniref:Uncharacterized protein n=1 Tax=Zingiber officinale TaxID=94328 RepID=A0A8J5C775_ZINOF|nr:hypothetical protein ZIOFF_067730 [Zingiber officinale]
MGTGKDSSEATDDLDDMSLAERRSLIHLRKAASPLSRVPEPPKCFRSAFSAYASFYYFLGRIIGILWYIVGKLKLKQLFQPPVIASVIEDMSIQVNVPALAMEEVAPLVVSDAAMLAPEEIFHGKGNIKEEAELTKEERKRRRANQKRRFRRLKGSTFDKDSSQVYFGVTTLLDAASDDGQQSTDEQKEVKFLNELYFH